jgi:DnaK suppressor protein
MDAEAVSEMRSRLLALRATLEQVAATGAASSAVVELDQSAVGRLSRMDAMQAQAMSQASGRRREHQQHSITAALSRLDKGEFGDCRECGEPIARKRLEFDPTAVLCIGCASNREKAEN